MTTLLFLAASPIALAWFLIYIVVFLIIAGLVFWAINKLSAAFGIPEPIRTVIIVLLVIVIIIGLLYMILGGAPPMLGGR